MHILNTFGKQTRKYSILELLDLHCTAVVLEVAETKRNQFGNLVNSQFVPRASAAKLFKYIDKEKHEMLADDVSRLAQAGMSQPTQIPDEVADKYIEYWAPPALHAETQIHVAIALNRLREHVVDLVVPADYNVDTFVYSI